MTTNKGKNKTVKPEALFFDEFGRPFLVFKERNEEKCLSGAEVLTSNIQAARAIANTLKTSLGPKGLDKMMVDEDGDVSITNDGATILDIMDPDHEIAKIFVEVSKTQDVEVGDGTTGVIVLAGALLEQVETLIGKGIHPIRIADGFDLAAKHTLRHLEHISKTVPIDLNDLGPLTQIAKTALGSKLVSKCHDKMADIAVRAVLNVADIRKKYVNLDWIKIEKLRGAALEDTMFIDGIAITESFIHPQMPKELHNVKIALLTRALELPKVEMKINLEIKDVTNFSNVQKFVDDKLEDMVLKIKETGASLVICQFAIDEVIRYILLKHQISAIAFAMDSEIAAIARATGGRSVRRLEDLTPEKLGFAGSVRETNIGTTKNPMILIEKCRVSNVSTIVIRGNGLIIIDEAKRSLHDAMCVVKNLIQDNRIVYGGGASELSCSIAINNEADKISTVEQYAFRAFAEALESIPLALAENSGLNAFNVLTELKAEHIIKNKPVYGVDCVGFGTNDMEVQQVIDTLESKKQQIVLATNSVKMILKIDEIRVPEHVQEEM